MKLRRLAFTAAAALQFVTLSATVSAQEKDVGGSDHEKVVKRLGIGYLGLREVNIGSPATAVPAPIIGGRYWLTNRFAVEAGVGLGWISGSSDKVTGGQTTTVESPSGFAFALHGGVPISLASGKHTSFQLIPELNLGFGTGTIKNANAPDSNLTGFLLEAGARAGLEVHFGFIGVPELSLVGSVGLYFRHEGSKTSQEVNGTTSSASVSSNKLGTSVGPNPWAIFTNNISAIYYF